MSMPVRQRKRGNRIEVLPEAQGVPQSSASLPKTCTEKAMELWRKREKRLDSVRQHFVLSTRCREENRPREELSTKAWEPALYTHARQEAYKDEVGTCKDRSGWIWLVKN